MKTTLLIITGILLVAGLVSAQPGTIQIFSDASLQDCDLTDDPPGPFTVYIYHINTNGSTASSFKVDLLSGGSTVTYLAHNSPFLTIGHPTESIGISYGICQGQTGPFEILSLFLTGAGTSLPCSYIEVVEDPLADPVMIQITDCINPVPNTLPGGGSIGYFNNDGLCPCETVPVEETSWGQIKALYR